MSEIIWQKTLRARKEHKCDWCKHPIKNNELYERSFNKDGGEPFTWKNHSHCSILYDVLEMDNGWGDGVDSYNFMEHVTNYLRENLSKEEFNKCRLADNEIVKVCELLKINMEGTSK